MKGFKKLILTSAILAASTSAFAMQALDEDTLSSTTGQDGLTINIANSTISNLDITWVDRDGFGTNFTGAGGVDISPIGLSMSNLVLTIDAGNSTTNGAQLNIGFSTNNNVVVSLNNTTISVGNAAGVNTTTTAMSGVTPIIQFGGASTLTLSGGLSGSIKLGNRAAGEHLMQIATAAPVNVQLAGGVDILSGAGTGIEVGTITVNSLKVATAIDATAAGLQVDTTGTTIGQVSLERIKLGNLAAASPSIGDVYLSGMNVATQLTITGH